MKDFKRGLKAGIPIGLGYLSVSFTFGIIAISYGFTWWEAVLISMTTVTSAGQFAGIGIMTAPGYYLSMLISQLTINVRYSFMSVSLSQKLEDKFRGIKRWLLGFFMTDEIFAVASNEKEVTVPFFAGLSVIPYFGWALGTFLGAILGNVLPENVMSALGLAIYGMFIAIVVPDMKGKLSVSVVVIIAAALATAFKYVPYMKNVSIGIAISISAIVAAVVGALLFPVNDEDSDQENDKVIETEVL
jgi:4-azaleucine resistance transporter AzlC